MASQALSRNIETDKTDSILSNLSGYRLLELDEFSLIDSLSATSIPQRREASSDPDVILSLPLPNGKFVKVKATPFNMLSDEVASEIPEFRTWRISGVGKSVVGGVIDTSSEGFHGLISLANGNTVLIDPVEVNSSRKYVSFNENAYRDFDNTTFSCGTHDQSSPVSSSNIEDAHNSANPVSLMSRGSTTNTLHYDVAFGVTEGFVDKAGGRTAAGGVIATMLSRTNAIFFRDANINLTFAYGFADMASSSAVLYLPFLTGTTAAELKDQNADFMADLSAWSGLDRKKYDLAVALGVSSNAGGGEALTNSVCTDNKERAAVISSHALDGAIYYKLLAHEIGHQFGAQHTFNKCVNPRIGNITRFQSSAVEPGGGSTLMSYGNACGDLNSYVSPNGVGQDAMLHIHSIDQVVKFSRGTTGSSCATKSDIPNKPPVPTVKATNYTIPARTPFVLSGSATDANNDVLTYSWDEVDIPAGVPFISTIGVDRDHDNGKDPLIRTRLPVSSPVRYIPDLKLLLTKQRSLAEYLPVKSRSLKFELVTRDQKGGVGSVPLNISVKDTGAAFKVTYPGISQTDLRSFANKDLTVKWDVAGTKADAAFQCQTVDLAITVNEGSSFINLSGGVNVDNNGSRTVRMPGAIPLKSHIRVMCAGGKNIFFAISGTNPLIAAPK